MEHLDQQITPQVAAITYQVQATALLGQQITPQVATITYQEAHLSTQAITVATHLHTQVVEAICLAYLLMDLVLLVQA